MSKDKHTTNDEQKKPVEDEKVVSLEIADDDAGSDPYNCTGSFCVPEFDEAS